jgi:hypothetical protein
VSRGKFAGFVVVVGLVAGLSSKPGFAENGLVAPANFAANGSSALSMANASVSSSAVVVLPPPVPARNPTQEGGRVRPFSRIAFATNVGTLGWGGQIATPITRWLNLRGGADFFNFGYGLTSDGTNYYASLHVKSGIAQVDFFPFRHSGFHISPGVLVFKSNAAASMNVPGGSTFSENDTNYTSDPTDPVNGTGTVTFTRSIMPAATFGFSNMIARRENRHWSVPIEMGAAYTGHYAMQANLTGSACQQGGCGSVAEPSIQLNVVQQQNKINEQMKHFQLYPILTTGVSFRF